MHESESSKPATGVMGTVSTLALSAEAIYGLIVVAGMIVVSRNLTGGSGEALFSVVATLLVFFAAHVYAAGVSWLANSEDDGGGLRGAFWHGMQESAGMLIVGAIPVAILFLGVLGVLKDSDAVWLALATDVLLLGLLGWVIAAVRTRNIWARLGSVLLTAAFGGILIGLKALVHH